MDRISSFNNFLSAHKIKANCVSIDTIGYGSRCIIVPKLGFKLKTLTSLREELSIMLRAVVKPNIRCDIERGAIYIDIIEQDNLLESKWLSTVSLFKNKNDTSLPIRLGETLDGEQIVFSIVENPHLLVAGTTGSGKSTILHNICCNLLFNNCSSIYIIDPKGSEYSTYGELSKNIHTVSSVDDAALLIQYLLDLMAKRFSLYKHSYSNKLEPIVLIIDEFADLIIADGSGELLDNFCRLIQKCRAAGIYCVVATQRPSVDIISGTIKANIPARISCKTASKLDSRIILDQIGAENLNGKGDSIISNYKYKFKRFQAYNFDMSNVVNLYRDSN